jgi:GLPGLI family protein
MKKIYITIILICIAFLNIKAQELFIKQAKITYEKKKKIDKIMADLPMGTSFVKGAISTWTVTFDQDHSLYKYFPINDDASMYRDAMNQNSKDEFYFDFQKTQRTRKKTVGKEVCLLEDTIPPLKWKILPEVREIAGYECRKALTIINDSVYVVAFYTDRILLKGGPEGFNGLPGMILGLAIPRMETTWFATKVDLGPVDPKELQVPAGTKTSANELKAKIDKSSPFLGTPKAVVTTTKQMFGFLL